MNKSPINTKTNLKSMQASLPKWMPRMAFAPDGVAPRGDVLICIFQRGGMDGLNALVPLGDSDYFRARPTLGIQPPKTGDATTAIALDNFFGLHPALAALKPIWDAKQLAPIHACGSPDPTHSHFDAMDYMERGTPGAKTLGTGWLGRHLVTLNTGNASPLRAVGMGNMLQQSLRGPVSATALQSIANFHLRGQQQNIAQIQQALAQLYAIPQSNADPLLASSAEAIDSIFGLLGSINPDTYIPANGAQYPQTDFGQGLKQIAQIIKAEVGLEVACVDIGGWDTHAEQADELTQLLAEFGNGLAALWADLRDKLKSVVIVTMSEFGRRLAENGSGGTDHGQGNAMFVVGGSANGGKVHGRWPGLASDKLVGPGDLAMTTDYRTILSEILLARLGNKNLAEVFPGFNAPGGLGVVQSNLALLNLSPRAFLPMLSK